MCSKVTVNFSDGTSNVTFKDSNGNVVTENYCSTTTTTTPSPTFSMVWDTVNDIPLGQCRPETLHVTSSVAGTVQVSPDKGMLSKVDCYQPDIARSSVVTFPVAASSQAQDLIVYVYATAEPSATSLALTATPLFFAGVDSKANTLTLTVPISQPAGNRPPS